MSYYLVMILTEDLAPLHDVVLLYLEPTEAADQTVHVVQLTAS